MVTLLCSASHCCDCRRKSLGGNWKTNVGQSILEEVQVEERYKLWVDQVTPTIHTTITTEPKILSCKSKLLLLS